MEQKYYPVNWTDGMKINKSTFNQHDNAIIYQLSLNSGALLNDYNYGLLPAPGRNVPDVKIYLHTDNHQQVKLRLLQCRAITRGGYYIEFNEEESFSEKQNMVAPIIELSVPPRSIDTDDKGYMIVVSANPYQRVPFGLADLEETPTRLPNSRPQFELSLMPFKDNNNDVLGLFSLPIGLLKLSHERAVLDERYIPPCNSLCSHYDLIELHAVTEQFYAKMEMYALQIVQKIYQKKQSNEISGIVQKICENIILHTTSHFPELKNISLFQPPISIITRVQSMAQLLKTTLDFFTGSGKEEFVNYCDDWCDTNRGMLEGIILTMNNNIYDHLNIKSSIDKISDFIKILSNLFKNLSGLDYIGKRKEAGIFVKENPVIADREETKRKRIYLTD